MVTVLSALRVMTGAAGWFSVVDATGESHMPLFTAMALMTAAVLCVKGAV